MVAFDDTAALAGIAIAAVGIGLQQITGHGFWDPAASIVIGVLLIGVAGWMARNVGGLLVGAAADPEERAAIERVIEDHPDVVEVQELLTMALGPNALLVAARVDVRDAASAREIEEASTTLDHALRAAVPDVTEVFLDATPGRPAQPLGWRPFGHSSDCEGRRAIRRWLGSAREKPSSL